MKKLTTLCLVLLISSLSMAQIRGGSGDRRNQNDNGTTQERPYRVNSSYTYLIKNTNGLALDISGGKKDSGTNIQIYDQNRSVAQQFRFVEAPGGYFYILNENSGKFLSVQNGRIENGSNVQIYKSSSSPKQKWSIVDAGEGTIYIKAYDKDLYLMPQFDGGKGTNVIIGRRSFRSRWILHRI
jgi:hypothetical protein